MEASVQPLPSVKDLVDHALEARERKAWPEAERLLRQALQARPGDAGVLRLLADLFVQAGRPDAALPIYDAILQARPEDANLLHNRGVALMSLGRAAEAAQVFEAAAARRPGYVSAHFNGAICLANLGRLAEAEAAYARAIALEPGHGAAINNRGAALIGLGRPTEALACFERALELNASDAGAHANRANALCSLGRPREALAAADRALELQPNAVAALLNRGLALNDLGHPDEALRCFDLAVRLAPAYAEAHSNRGNVLHALRRPEDAVAAYERALEIRPDFPEALSNRGNVLRELGRTDDALASLDRAIALRPAYADAWENRGVTLVELGRIDEAIAAIETTLELAPDRVRPNQVLIELRKVTPGDRSLQALEAAARRESALFPEDRIRLNFALGKAYADLGEHDRCFARYARGGVLKRAASAYDEAATMQAIGAIIEAYDKTRLRRRTGKGDPSRVPVFVLGMPRSGTTLIEQILSRHPKVLAAGETPAFADALDALGGEPRDAVRRMADFADLSPGTLKALGADYLARVCDGAPAGVERIVNKTTVNFLIAGLIHLALPKARIIHARRDAADTCWSCFTKLFVHDLPHTYDLRELGRYYRAYERLMEHWRQALPPGVMLEVQYEDVVSDLEGQARRMVEHCGLEWDPACLDFHAAERQVRTASVLQVRRPIYATSVGRWRAYEKHLGPLLEALGRPTN